MNFKIDTLVRFDGTEEQFQNLVADIGQILVDWGLGNTDDGEVSSLIVVNNFDVESEEEFENWLQDRVNEGAFLALPVEG